MRSVHDFFAKEYGVCAHRGIYKCIYTYMNTYADIDLYMYHINHFWPRDGEIARALRSTRWLRSVGPIKLQVYFAEYSLFYGAFLQKRPII